MPRGRRRKTSPEPFNVETHPLNEHVLPALMVSVGHLETVKQNMLAPEIMDAPMHGWTHILHMLVYASRFCIYADFDFDIVRWAILTHDSGRVTDDRNEPKHGLVGAYVFNEVYMSLDTMEPGEADTVAAVVDRHSDEDKSQSTEEAIVRACERLDLYRMPDFDYVINPALMEAPGWQKVEKTARRLRLGGYM